MRLRDVQVVSYFYMYYSIIAIKLTNTNRSFLVVERLFHRKSSDPSVLGVLKSYDQGSVDEPVHGLKSVTEAIQQENINQPQPRTAMGDVVYTDNSIK